MLLYKWNYNIHEYIAKKGPQPTKLRQNCSPYIRLAKKAYKSYSNTMINARNSKNLHTYVPKSRITWVVWYLVIYFSTTCIYIIHGRPKPYQSFLWSHTHTTRCKHENFYSLATHVSLKYWVRFDEYKVAPPGARRGNKCMWISNKDRGNICKIRYDIHTSFKNQIQFNMFCERNTVVVIVTPHK